MCQGLSDLLVFAQSTSAALQQIIVMLGVAQMCLNPWLSCAWLPTVPQVNAVAAPPAPTEKAAGKDVEGPVILNGQVAASCCSRSLCPMPLRHYGSMG